MGDHASRAAGFPTTDWSLVDQCHDDAGFDRQTLGELVRIYSPALRSYLRNVKRCNADVADELLQSFITCKLLEQAALADAKPALGRFRSYLLTLLNRHMTDDYRRGQTRAKAIEQFAQMDRGRATEPADPFDVVWAKLTLDQAASRMREHLERSNRPELWRLFERRVLEPILARTKPPSYESLVEEFGFASATQACSAIVTARRMYARYLRSVITSYSASEDEIEGELSDLHRILAAARR